MSNPCFINIEIFWDEYDDNNLIFRVLLWISDDTVWRIMNSENWKAIYMCVWRTSENAMWHSCVYSYYCQFFIEFFVLWLLLSVFLNSGVFLMANTCTHLFMLSYAFHWHGWIILLTKCMTCQKFYGIDRGVFSHWQYSDLSVLGAVIIWFLENQMPQLSMLSSHSKLYFMNKLICFKS